MLCYVGFFRLIFYLPSFFTSKQAIGRVIRHKSDWGAIILCDQRFSSAAVTSQLPSWVRPYANSHANFGLGLKSLVGFFKEAKVSLPQPSKVNKNVKQNNNNNNDEKFDVGSGGFCGRGGGGGSACVKSESASSCVDAFSYQKRSSSSSAPKSNSVDYHVPSLDAGKRRRYDDDDDDNRRLRSDITTPPQTQAERRKRTLKIEYEDERDAEEGERKKKAKPEPGASSFFDALNGDKTTTTTTTTLLTKRRRVGMEEKSEAEVALERRMANQQAKKKIRVAPGGGVGLGKGGGGGPKESLINQVLKKTVGVAKPLKTSTPKRNEYRYVRGKTEGVPGWMQDGCRMASANRE